VLNIVAEGAIIGHVFESGGLAQLRIVERMKGFHLNDEVVLEKQELKEVCFSVLSVGQQFLQGVIFAAREAGLLQQAVDEKLNDPKPATRHDRFADPPRNCLKRRC
jgi:hypothetical protein